MRGLSTLFKSDNQEKNPFDTLLDEMADGLTGMNITGITGAQYAYLVTRIFQATGRTVMAVAPTAKMAEQFLGDMRFFSENENEARLYFPPYNIIASQHLSYHNETAAQRIAALYRFSASQTAQLGVTTLDALLQRLAPKAMLNDFSELLMPHEALERERLIGKLHAGGYTRTMIVEEPGDYCVRGGILDVFSPLYPDPLRIEFFGDTVDSIRFFSAATQRSTQPIEEAIIVPAREVVLKMETLDEVLQRIRKRGAEQNLPVTQIRALVERIKSSGPFPGIESMSALIYPEMNTLFDYIPADTIIILLEPEALRQAAEALAGRVQAHYETACREPRLCTPPESLYLSWEELMEALREKAVLSLGGLGPLPPPPAAPNGSPQSAPRPQVRFHTGNNAELQLALKAARGGDFLFEPLIQWIHTQGEAGMTRLLVCRSRSQADRLHGLLAPYGMEPQLRVGCPGADSRTRGLFICIGELSAGFVWPEAGLAAVTEDEIFGGHHHRRSRIKATARAQLLELADLKQSDLVVHQQHGIGQYEGLTKLTLEGHTNDFLLISYRDGDKLYLPVDRMNIIQKYIGVDSVAPVLDKLGGVSWERVRAKVKRSAEKMAGELLKLYASRKVERGTAFTAVDRTFREFETAFPFEETDDQMKAIDEVLADMGQEQPMDRLVCGDVGYGKTEVALRAAFLAANGGRQVAVLVPTTVLAEQHFKTFSERFERYPFFVECLSRFRTPKQQRRIVEDLKSGKIDIVIGTHRLLSKDIAFKDLGLIILDEEQRFGVKHKEKLKRLRHTVDVLALTATPIPRTLHLSMVGIRDISIISTPPEQRHPIVSYICEIDDVTIAEAVQKELSRGGQIFFVHNHVATIEAMALRIQKLVPQVRLGIAHGQMPEEALEKVMFRFLNRELDLLVCTTIIESGLDVGTANTILINRADRFGLSQIYQLRGRVGRSDEQAYAYLFIPPDSAMGTDAQKRLKVLMEHSDLGSGFQIAMNDLQIRGGGTILGASQSGHIAAVGYDMFLQLMENAISELKGQPVTEPLEPEINLTLSAYIPEDYIPNIDQRLAVYRRLSNLTESKGISEFKGELQDRFGALPAEATNLLFKILLRVLCIKAGVRRLDLKGPLLMLQFSQMHQRRPLGLVDMVTKDPDRYRFTPEQGLKVRLQPDEATSALVMVKNILKDISQHVNG
jgi:transcription-repair coupling factor (superfamily II helicase)